MKIRSYSFFFCTIQQLDEMRLIRNLEFFFCFNQIDTHMPPPTGSLKFPF